MNKKWLHEKQEKDRIILKNTICAFVIKGVALMLSFFTMPVYMRFFSDQKVLGVWFTILSVLTWILNFDLGIGNGLRNNLTVTLTVGDEKKSREYIASAYWMIGGIILIILLVGSVIIPTINWNTFFNVNMRLISNDELARVVHVTFIGIMIQFQLRLISSVLYALQKSAVNNMIALVTSLLQLMVALIAPKASAVENLRLFSTAYVFCANLPLLVATIVVFVGPMRKCQPKMRYFRRDKAKSVLSLGGIFFFCQIAYMVIANTNEFFITQYTDAENVVEYQIYNKLFSLESTLFMLALTPIWSAISRATAEKDYLWIQRINGNLMKLSAIAVAGEFLMIPFLQLIINLWLGESAIDVNYGYAISFAIFGAAMVVQNAISTITNGLGRMKIQAVCYGVGVLIKFLIIYVGVRITGDWIVVVLANAVILIPYCIIQQIDLRRYIASKLVT